MNAKFSRLAPLMVSLFGILGCQEQSADLTASQSRNLPLAMRLVVSGSDTLPAADSLHFYVSIGTKTHDTTVGWSRRELDLGAVPIGTSVTWQVKAIHWLSDTLRRVVWTSDTLHAQAIDTGNDHKMTLNTLVSSKDSTAPAIASQSFTADGTGKVALSYADSAYSLSFQLAEVSKVTVTRNDTTWSADGSGKYSLTLRLGGGQSTTLRVALEDSLGNLATRTWTFTRATKPVVVVDSTISVSLTPPLDGSSRPHDSSSVGVAATVHSALHIDSVLVAGQNLTRQAYTTKWRGVVPLEDGSNGLVAVAWSGHKSSSSATVQVTRLAAAVDSTVTVAITVPSADTSVAYAQASAVVSAKVSAVLHVDSVLVAGHKLTRQADTMVWTGAASLIQGANSLVAMAYAGTKSGVSATRKVTRLAQVVDSTVTVAIMSPSADTSVTYAQTNAGVNAKVSAVLHVDSVLVAGQKLTRQTDTSVWIGSVGLTQGTNSLIATAYAGTKSGASVTRKVTRLAAVAADTLTTLHNLAVDAGTLSPAFDSTKAVYVDSLAPTAISFTVTAVVSSGQANVTYNGRSSGTFSLATDSVIQVAVTNMGVVRTYTIRAYHRSGTVAAPTFSLATGSYAGVQKVGIASATSGASIYYTTNGSAPTSASTLYTDSITVDASETVKAIAVVTGMVNSSVSSATYTLSAIAPTFSPPGGTWYDTTQMVTITSATSGTSIYYTTDGTDPAISPTAQRFTGPVAVGANLTLTAIAVKSGVSNSAEFGALYTIIPWSAVTYGSLFDPRDNHTYRTVQIGTQTWMAENLNFAGALTSVGVCYNSDTGNCRLYGRLYTWAEAMALASTYNSTTWGNDVNQQGICPSGWHVPSDAEWTTMVNAVEADSRVGSGKGGTALKARSDWSTSGNGTDLFGFRVLPASYVNGGLYGYLGGANFWSASDNGATSAWSRDFDDGNAGVIHANVSGNVKTYGFSLRCLENLRQ